MDDFIGGNYKSPTEGQKNAKKWMKVIGVLLVFLLIMSIILIGLIYYIESTQLKIMLDGKKTAQLDNVLIFENGKVYIPIRTFATKVGYESSNGDYNQDKYTEDTTKCYVKCSDEVATFSLGSNKIYKTLLDGSNDYEYYEIAEPVRVINNQLCTTIEGAKIAFNISMDYSQEENQVTIFTLPYLVTYYTAKFQNAGIADKDANFSNQKALLYNMIIVKNAENYYGVYDLNNKEILGTKYASIKFIESTKEFIVTTQEKKMGIISYNATTKINPQYDAIKQIDKDSGLYLVTNDKKQGVINEYGSTIVYIEYDQIGIDSNKYKNNQIQNQYLLYDKCIPVKKNNEWSLFDKTGKQITQTTYEDFGCTAGSGGNSQNANGVLLIPDYEGIVVKKQNLYGLIDSNGKDLLPITLKSFYSTTSAGETTYSMLYNEQVINVITYIETYVRPKDQNQSTNNNQNGGNNNTQNVENNEQTNQGNSANGNQIGNEQTNTANNNTVPTSGNVVQGNHISNQNTQNENGTPNTNQNHTTSGNIVPGNTSSGVSN